MTEGKISFEQFRSRIVESSKSRWLQGFVDIITRFLSSQPRESVNDPDDDDGVGNVNEAFVREDFVAIDNEDAHTLRIQELKQFETVVECLSVVFSFRGISKVFNISERALRNAKLGRPSERSIGRDVRGVVALNLTAIGAVLDSVWGFSILVDDATHKAKGYLDVRLAFELKREIYNIHLLALPMGDQRHTSENYAENVLFLLKNIPGQRLLAKLISITSDGASTMMGCRQGFARRLRDACESDGARAIMVNWCGSHQLNFALGHFRCILTSSWIFAHASVLKSVSPELTRQ